MLPATRKAVAGKPRCELADIFRQYGDSYRRTRSLPLSHLKVMRAIELCRTAALGGHMEQCDSCGFARPAFNSCRNRHCPKCQTLAKARWLEKQKSELLRTGYFHLVFTLPHELNPLILRNKRALCNILFKAVSHTLSDFGKTHLGGTLGVIAVLHTWDQTLNDHFHLHCLVPAGALSFDRTRWVPARKNFLFSVKALSVVFRGKFLALLQKTFREQKLIFPGQIAPLAEPETLDQTLKALRAKPWVVYAKEPFASPEKVLDYLGRYTHRVALSNDRILSVDNGQVTFKYRDRRRQSQRKTIKLKVEEFIRRFLLHTLPSGFVRIRHFGFLANASKKQRLSRCRRLLSQPPLPIIAPQSAQELMLKLTGTDISRCPACGSGALVSISKLPVSRSNFEPWNSS